MEKPVLIDIHKKRNQRISEEMIEHATAFGKRDRVDLRPQAGFVFSSSRNERYIRCEE